MPAPQNYEIALSTDNVTYTALSDVQTINARIGRQQLIDPFQPSQLTFTMRYPSGFATPNANLVTGTWVRLRNLSTVPERIMWRGRISNVAVDWGIPYGSSVGPSDYVTVTAEGAAGLWGRMQGNGAAIPASDAATALTNIAASSSLSVGTTFVAGPPNVAASTVDTSYLDWINLFATTLSATVKDGSGILGVYTKDFTGSLPVNFSDTTNNATNQRYEEIEVSSLVENYFTQVIVNTVSAGQVIVNTGSAPYRTLTIDTINATADQATDLANYYLTIYNTPRLTINSVTCRSETQNNWNLDLGNGLYEWWDMLGYRTYVTFRGTTTYMTILGCSMQATPAGSTFTYHLMDRELTPWFVLDSAQYGVLGTNKLSW